MEKGDRGEMMELETDEQQGKGCKSDTEWKERRKKKEEENKKKRTTTIMEKAVKK